MTGFGRNNNNNQQQGNQNILPICCVLADWDMK